MRVPFYLRLWTHYVSQYLKRRLIYQVDFLTGLAANMTLQAVNLTFLFVIFSQVPTLKGWNREEVLFIYGLSIMAYGLFHAFFSNVYYLAGSYIVEGNMDRVLLRPLNPLFQIYCERVDLEDIGETMLGAGLMAYAAAKLDLQWSLLQIAALPVWILCGVAIFLGVYTLISSFSFWFVDRLGLIPPVYNMMAFGRYPVTIYSRGLRFLMSWVIPFAFVGFYPATYFLNRTEFMTHFLLVPVVAIVFFAAGCAAFYLGLRRYESSGT